MSPKGGGLQELVLGTGWRAVGPAEMLGAGRRWCGEARQRRAVQGPVLQRQREGLGPSGGRGGGGMWGGRAGLPGPMLPHAL